MSRPSTHMSRVSVWVKPAKEPWKAMVAPGAERQTNVRGHGNSGSGAAHAGKLMRKRQVGKS